MHSSLQFDPRQAQGVNLDLDNCLIHSDGTPGSEELGLHEQSWQRGAEALLQTTLTDHWESIWDDIQGFPEPVAIDRMVDAIEARVGVRLDPQDLCRARRQALDTDQPACQLTRGALQVVRWYHERDVPMNIVTSSGTLFLEWVLASTPLGSFIDLRQCVTADHEVIAARRAWKPDGLPWRLAREALGLSEDACILRVDDTATCLAPSLMHPRRLGYLVALDAELRDKSRMVLHKAQIGPERAHAAVGFQDLLDGLGAS